MLGVVNEAVSCHADCRERVEECVDRTVTFADDFSVSVAVVAEHALKPDLRRGVIDLVLFVEFVADERIGTVNVDIFAPEQLHDLVRAYFPADLVTVVFDRTPEFGMHRLGQIVAEVIRHNKCRAALAGLAVDADYRLVFAPEIGRVYRKIRHFPVVAAVIFHILLALVYRVLMRTRERGENKLAGVRVPRLNVHVRRAFVYVFYRVYVVQIKLRVDALSIKIERKSYEIDISRPLAVSEERALDSFGSREHTELRRGDCRSAVVVRVQADYCIFAVGETAAKIFYLIREKIRRAALDCRGEIQYHFVVLIRTECVHDRCADVCGKVCLRAHEAFG